LRAFGQYQEIGFLLVATHGGDDLMDDDLQLGCIPRTSP
jgi:hypothetical protein